MPCGVLLVFYWCVMEEKQKVPKLLSHSSLNKRAPLSFSYELRALHVFLSVYSIHLLNSAKVTHQAASRQVYIPRHLFH
jgi:hypothetical protein